MPHILYREKKEGEFEFLEVENLEDFDDSTLDGRLYRIGGDDEAWWELFEGDLERFCGMSDFYIKALCSYVLEQPKLFANLGRYARMSNNLPNDKLTPEERSERARKAVQARWNKSK